ncbi:biliverdin-producing heme oxygenase [Chitinophaga agrisoli]|uniref:biliverdin-producing heme oxygenase n=1 Tax=Chitinophaga agrisoli TaxID=2607653 RepID=UPI00166193D0|nr:biliverdin-producing heme oxygenase [Chitinophaga agrisoli]
MTEHLFAVHLKDYTKAEHASLEKKLIGMIKRIRTPQQYIALLRMFYAYYHALELKMDQYLSIDNVPDIDERRKSAAILQDIRFMGDTSPMEDHAVQTPEIRSWPQALGAAYVLEGSTLGGVIIARMISGQLAIPAGEGFSFFNGYGDAVHQMWKKFHVYLNSVEGKDDQLLAADAARQTFLTFSNWADLYESNGVFKI